MSFDRCDPTPTLDVVLEEIDRLKQAHDLLYSAHVYCFGVTRKEDEAARVEMRIADFFGSSP